MNPVPTVYPQKLLSEHLCYQRSKLFTIPDELSAFQQRDIRTFQDLNKSVAPAGFRFFSLDNCI